MKKITGYFTSAEVVESLRLKRATYVSQAAFAKALNISPALLCEVLQKKKSLPEAALVALGLEKVEQLYRRKGK